MNPTVAQLLEAYQRGHAWNTAFPNLANLDAGRIAKMDGSERDAKDLMASRQMSDGNMERLVEAFHQGRELQPDGDVGPATEALLEIPRCPIPDFAPPPGATFGYDDPELQKIVEGYQEAKYGRASSGSFPFGCHGTKYNPDGPQTHEVTISYDWSSAPSNVKGPWREELRQRAHFEYAQMGVRLIEVPLGQTAQIRVWFRSFVGGTIGLAQFNNRTCGASVFCNLSSSYQPSVGLVLILLKHEIGHNVNFDHISNSIMNPSIMMMPRIAWVVRDGGQIIYQDKRFATGRTFFRGGDAVTVHGVTPGPGPGPGPVPQQKLWLRTAAGGTFEVVALQDFTAKAGDVLSRQQFAPYQPV